MSEESTKTPRPIGEVTGRIISRANGREIIQTEDGDEIAVPMKSTPPPAPSGGEGAQDTPKESPDQLSRLFEANKELSRKVDNLMSEIVALKADRERWMGRAQAAERDLEYLTGNKPQFRIVQRCDEAVLASMTTQGWTVEHMQGIPKAHGDTQLFVVFRREPEKDNPPEKREAVEEVTPSPSQQTPSPVAGADTQHSQEGEQSAEDAPMPERQTLVGVDGARLDDLGLLMGWTEQRRRLTRDELAGIFTRARAALSESDIDYRSPLRDFRA